MSGDEEKRNNCMKKEEKSKKMECKGIKGNEGIEKWVKKGGEIQKSINGS